MGNKLHNRCMQAVNTDMEYALGELIKKLSKCQKNRFDVISDEWSAVTRGRYLMIRIGDHGNYGLTEHAHEQASQILDIPKRYYDKLRTANPDLLRTNINELIDKRCMFRIVDDKIIAVLSDQYRILNNYDVLMCALDTVKKTHHHGVVVSSCELSDTKIYIKMLQPGNAFDIVDNEEITPGIVLQNSEVGAGAFSADMYLIRNNCGNGMIGERSMHRTHRGRKIEPGIIRSTGMNETMWQWAADLIDKAFDPKPLNKWIAMIRNNIEVITEKPIETIDTVSSDYRLTEQQKTSALNYFLQYGDRTKWSLANAVSMTGMNCEDPDNAIMLERIAGKIAANPHTRIQTPLT